MPPPNPVKIYHFTHVDHLPGIIEQGLLCDSAVGDLLTHEAGDHGIKARRRRASVPVGTGGAVADYAPFYFAPRSPMLYKVSRGGVETFTGEQRELVYVCTTLEFLDELGLSMIVTDRNAATAIARFTDDPREWMAEGFVDWNLMRALDWFNDPDHPDRKERRMAECLIYQSLPWEAVMAIGCFDEHVAERVRRAVDQVGHSPNVLVRPEWYF